MAKDKNDQEPRPPAARWDENNPTINYRGEKRSNQTHCSTTDPEAMLARKGPGKEAKLSYHGHLMTENRNGLVVNAHVTTAYGSAECHAGLLMAEQLPGCGRVTLGADKGYDQREFIEELRQMEITPHVAQNQSRRRSRLDQRTTRAQGSQNQPRRELDRVQSRFFSSLLGEKAEAFERLENALAERDTQITELAIEPQFDALRSDARFADLERRIGLLPR